jgi:rRNA-processing protein FCF1
MPQNIVVLDSNFILLPFQFKIDYLSEIKYQIEGKIEFIIYKQVLDELEAKRKRESNATKFHFNLNSGLTYLDKYKENFNIIYDNETKEQHETTDQFLLRICNKLKTQASWIFLATNDALLRKFAREQDINLIYLRQKKYIVVERV